MKVYDRLYKYAGHQYNNLSLKEILNHCEIGTHQQLVDKYTKLITTCNQYGRHKLGIYDTLINETIVEGLCNIIYLEAIGSDLINVEQYFDTLVDHRIMTAITKANLLKDTMVHPYNKRDSKQKSINDAYYKSVRYPMNIRLKPDEFEILVPIDHDDHGHIYYQWVELGNGYNPFVDTGNHAISGMSDQYFNSKYLSLCPKNVKKAISDTILDTKKPALQTCGIGGESKCGIH